ncbi:GNAT family N-acetyltransferase [Tateyamaria armeniaca]|uniref:GNAT family N-acetyltransferase n=1 Tax=Tateyamaria armeniaca TaxID=2518930 RepID=A0ABW8UW68_9RHOB
MTSTTFDIPTLRTLRLTLRAPLRDDFDDYAAMLADPRSAHMGGPFSRRVAWDFFCNATAQWQLSGFGGWMIDSDGAWVGEIAIQQPDHFPEPELGWSLKGEAEGKGYALEAATAALRWYWRRTQSSTLVSYITPGNARSETLATRLGATLDPDAQRPDGETADETAVFRHHRAEQPHAEGWT